MPYTQITDYFDGSDKSSRIRYRICIPTDNPKAIIQISHGMCEYFDRYEDTIKYFTDNGFIVCGNDHIGHGESVPDIKSLGQIKKDSYLCFADDLYSLNQIVKKRYPHLPYILLGHSMGSFIARDYISRYGNTVDGAVICGTSGTNKGTSPGIFLSEILIKLKGENFRSRFLKNLAFSGYNKRFSEKDENAWLCREESVRRAYAADTKCTFTFSVSAYNNLFKLLKKVSSGDWAKSVPKSLPIFLIAGTDDPVGAYGEGVREVFLKLQDEEINELKLKLYEGGRHEILNETNREEVWNDINDFASEVISGVLEVNGYGN